MATVPAHSLDERDHTALKEIGGFVVDMLGTFETHALTYCTAYYLHITENAPRPATPPLDPNIAKALREVVLDVIAMDRLKKRKAA